MLVAAKGHDAKRETIQGEAMRTVRTTMAISVLAMLASPAWADVAGRYETKDKNAVIDMDMTIETNDAGDVRLQTVGQAGYFLLKAGVLYSVSRGDAGPTVARVTDLLALQADAMRRMGVADRLAEAANKMPPLEFAKIGPEKVGPWQGTAYGVKSGSAKPGPYAAFVMSDDPRIAPLGKGIAAMDGGMMGSMGNMLPAFGPLGQEMAKFLSGGTPIRMMSLELTDVSFDPIGPDRFALPAQPRSLAQLKAQAEPFPPPPTLPSRKK